MQLVPIAHWREWSEALARFPQSHVLQTCEWGQVKGRWGWHPLRFLLRDGGEVRAAVSVLRRAVPPNPLLPTVRPQGTGLRL